MCTRWAQLELMPISWEIIFTHIHTYTELSYKAFHTFHTGLRLMFLEQDHCTSVHVKCHLLLNEDILMLAVPLTEVGQ